MSETDAPKKWLFLICFVFLTNYLKYILINNKNACATSKKKLSLACTNQQKLSKRGADVSETDVIFAPMY
jgi:hypothetical protein